MSVFIRNRNQVFTVNNFACSAFSLLLCGLPLVLFDEPGDSTPLRARSAAEPPLLGGDSGSSVVPTLPLIGGESGIRLLGGESGALCLRETESMANQCTVFDHPRS